MTSDAPTPQRAVRFAGAVLALLVAINMLNYIDRQVLAAVESLMQKDLFPEAPQPASGESDAQPTGSDRDTLPTGSQQDVEFWMGLLPTAFLLSYMIFSPIFGWLSDRMNRWWIIAGGVIVWSLASGASGLATSFGVLLATRLLVGIGEAAYGPAAPTLLADMYPLAKRARVLSLFYLAIPVGSALGYLLGGWIAERWDWRYAFYLSLPPGLALGLVCFWLRDPRKSQAMAADRPAPRAHSLADFVQLARTPSYVLNTLAMAAMTFALGAVAFWMPRYVYKFRHEDLPLDVPASLERVTTRFGAITVLAGITATLAGGWLGDKLRKRWSGSYFLVSGVGMLIGTPLFLLVLVTPFPAAWILIFVTEFCLFLSTGPANAALANVTRPAIRSSAFAINIFLIHLLGDAVSPPLVGKITSWAHGNMNVGFAAVSGAIVLSGILWIAGAPFLGRDTEAVSAGP